MRASRLNPAPSAGHERAPALSADPPTDRERNALGSPQLGRSGHNPNHPVHTRRKRPLQRRATAASPGCGPQNFRLFSSRCTRRAGRRHPHLGGVREPAESNLTPPIGAPWHRPGNPGASSMLVAVPAWPARASGRQAFAALGTAPVQHLAAVARRHAAAKTMARLADPVRRLERAFHRGHSRALPGPFLSGAAIRRTNHSVKRAADNVVCGSSQRR